MGKLRFVHVKSLIAAPVIAAATLAGAAGSAAAEPDAGPVIPDVSTFMPVNPADYTVNGGKWYAFAGPAGVVCFLNNLNGDYGCGGALPGAPEGTDQVGAGVVGAPVFSTAAKPIAEVAGPVRPLPPRTRLTFRQIVCGVDTDGAVACLNTREQVGFVIAPTGTVIKGYPPPPSPEPPAAPPAG